ncbi:MAG: type II/IV secretion system ATPase subunit [Methanomicrobiales archaeon]
MSEVQAAITLPFDTELPEGWENLARAPESSGLFRMLPSVARGHVLQNPHLLEYLHLLPVNTTGIPHFVTELTKDLRDLENPNIIYPVNDTTFVHIYPDPEDVRHYYIPIEPSFIHSAQNLMPAVEEAIIDLLDTLPEEPKSRDERAEILHKLLAEVTYINKGKSSEPVVTGEAKPDLKTRFTSFLSQDVGGGKKNRISVPRTIGGKIIVSPQEYRALDYLLIRDKVDMGILVPFLSDPNIEDISCDGVGPIFIEHKVFKSLKAAVGFTTSEDLDEYVIKMAERMKSPLTYRNPVVDSTLPDGSRINIVYGTEISKHGSNFTIRKFAGEPLSIFKVIESNTCDYMMAAYLWICLEFGMSLFVSGETASGKTTTLNALTTFLPPENKIVTIEDTPELQVPHGNWIREVAKGKGKGEGDGADVTMFDLLKAALRQRPNQILVGEIRGIEGSVAFGAMQTGHPVMSTFHAASVEKLIQRLTGDPILVPRTYLDNLNLVIIQSAVKRPGGGTVRRMMSINEMVGYDPESEGFSFMSAFTWDPTTDTFVFNGKGSSYLLENKVCTMLGIPESKRGEIYDEVYKRAKILERLHSSGYVRFWDLFDMITKIRRQGLLDIEVE